MISLSTIQPAPDVLPLSLYASLLLSSSPFPCPCTVQGGRGNQLGHDQEQDRGREGERGESPGRSAISRIAQTRSRAVTWQGSVGLVVCPLGAIVCLSLS
jgi:hypothetical protein